MLDLLRIKEIALFKVKKLDLFVWGHHKMLH